MTGDSSDEAVDMTDLASTHRTDRLKMRRRLLLGLGIGVAVVVAAIAVFVAVSQPAPMPESDPGVTSTGVPTLEPSASAAPTPAPMDAMPERYEYGLSQTDVQGLIDMPLEQFAALPFEQRLPLAQYYVQELPAFAQAYYSVSENELDIALPASIEATNSAEQSWAVLGNMRRLAVTLTDEQGVSIDAVAAKKLLLTTFMDANSTNLRNYFDYVDSVAAEGTSRTARSLAALRSLAFPISLDPLTELYVAPDGLSCSDLAVTERLATMEKLEATVQLCLVGEPGRQIWTARG